MSSRTCRPGASSAGTPETRRRYPPGFSFAPHAPRPLVVILGVVVDFAKQRHNLELLTASHVLFEGGVDRLLLCFVFADAAGLVEQSVIDGQIGGHLIPPTIHSTPSITQRYV